MGWCDFCNRANIKESEIKTVKTGNQTIYVCKRCLIDIWRKHSNER